MTMAKVFTPLVRDGIDPDRKTILLEDYVAWLVDRAEDNLVAKSSQTAADQQLILNSIETFLNDRNALGLTR